MLTDEFYPYVCGKAYYAGIANNVINLLLTISHYSGFCKQVYLVTTHGKILRIDTKFIWFERALGV